MPILPAEPDRYPDDLFGPTFDGAGDDSWWVLHAKPRQEKCLARHLRLAGLAYYLPTVSRRRRTNGRVLTTCDPLFTGYVFLRSDRVGRVAALASQRVVNAITVHDQPALWRDLRQIATLIATGAPVTAEERLAPGDPVEIASGPLAGLSGTVVRAASGRRFLVRVDFIQRGASVLLDDFALVPLRRAAVPI